MDAPVHMGLEDDGILGDLSEVAQAEALKASAVGQDGAAPAHEAVEAAQLLYHLHARAQVEMVGVAEHHRGAHGPQVPGVYPLDRALRGDRHEGRRAEVSVGGVEHPRPGIAVLRLDVEDGHGARYDWNMP